MSNALDTLRYSEDLDEAGASSGPASRRSDAEECLSDDEILAFAEGRLLDGAIGRVHAHADRCEICQQLLNQAVHGLATAPLSDADDNAPAAAFSAMLRPDELVRQRYRITRFVASGGMGEVYEAFDLDLGVRVALKTVKATACDSVRAVRRLKMEVQLARRVSHANVCRIFDLGTHESARDHASIHFLTMEYVEGKNLGERLRAEGALEIADAIAVAQQLLRGLGAAHAAGILHRDFKSDNVMLRSAAEASSGAVILDFGLARCLDADRASHTTMRGQPLLGTLRYMAPEQIEGERLTVRTDLYAFGIVLFEMLTGVLPFAEASAPATALFQRLREPPPAPSSFNPRVAPGLDAIVRRCLGRAPGERFGSAAEALEAFEAFEALKRAGEPSARPRTKAWVWGISVPLALALAGVGVQELTRQSGSGPVPERRVAAAIAPARPDMGILVTPPSYDVAPKPPEPPKPPPSVRAWRPRRPASAQPATPSRSKPAPDALAVASAVAPPALRPAEVFTATVPPVAPRGRGKPDWENPFVRQQTPRRAAAD